MVDTRRDLPAFGATQRLPGALIALAGALFALPSVFWPTSILTYSDPAREVVPDPNLDGQRTWSWGKSAQISQGQQLEPSQENVLGMALLVMLLLLGVAGALVYVLHERLPWDLVGVASTALITGRVLTAVVERLGNSLSDPYRDAGNGVQIHMTPAGSAEVVSAALLVLALAVMLLRPLVAAHRTVLAGPNGTSSATKVARQVVAGRARNGEADEPTMAPPRDGEASAPVVGFSKDSRDDRPC